MASDKPSASPARDRELRKILRAHDPAGVISPYASAQLAMSISRQALRHPQLNALSPESDYFIVPPIISGALSWPVTLVGTMMLGLMFGLCLSSMTSAPNPHYSVAATMAGPWHSFTE